MNPQTSQTKFPGFTCVGFDSVNKNQLFDFVISVYHSQKPMTTQTKLSKIQTYKLLFNYLEKSCQNKFSSVVLNEKGKIVCAQAILKWNDYLEAQPLKNSSMKIKLEQQLMNQSNKLYEPREENCQKSLIILLGATHRQYLGMGLFSSLNSNFIQSAKKDGIKEIIVDCTGTLQKKIFQKAKFECKGTLLFSQFQFNNKKPYGHIKNIEGVTRCVLNLDLL